ncbi:MAG: hypothetical protein ABW321_09820, partial [Polyangiales bacterium]
LAEQALVTDRLEHETADATKAVDADLRGHSCALLNGLKYKNGLESSKRFLELCRVTIRHEPPHMVIRPQCTRERNSNCT